MKNEKLFPLERNNYFFGKLMTEREFDAEQTYGNNKRRLLNLAILKPGIVCGMTVTRVDGATIAVESGLALDGLGRELALPELTLTLLSELEGFSGDRGHMGHVYLCAEYAEEQVEPVHALSAGTSGERFGRVRETVRLFLRYGEPEPFETECLSFEDNRAENLEDKLERRARITLYLAKIYLIRWKEAYEIDRIEQAPFDQYALSLTQSDIKADTPQAQSTGYSEQKSQGEAPLAISCGTAQVRILDGAKPGSVYYSEDIPHGLGLVPAVVTLGISSFDGAVFADPSVFGAEADFTYAAYVTNNNGTFKIGVRTKNRVSKQIIRFIWSAVTDPARLCVSDTVRPRIVVNPPSKRVQPFEMLRLTAEAYDLPEGEIVWSVREADGGEVTANGEYIAPANPGVYTVIARLGEVMGISIIIVS